MLHSAVSIPLCFRGGGGRQFMKFSLIFDHKRVAYEDDDVDVDGPFGLTAARKT